MKTLTADGNDLGRGVPARRGGVLDWQTWAPYAAVAWSLIYAALGVYWAVSGRDFPYSPETASDALAPLLGRLGPGMAWIVVILAGIPAAALGIAMLRGVRGRVLKNVLIIAGVLLGGALLMLMTGLDLLVTVGYIPFTISSLILGTEFGPKFLAGLAQGWLAHELLGLVGGFLWLAATFIYARRSSDACLYCGRRDGPEGWTSRDNAARWGRTAVYVSMIAPVFYALTRYAWFVGIPLGMSEAYWRAGQERGEWVSGLFLATFCLVGAAITLGLIQRWGEIFPRWMVGLAGRRVPIALAVIPASLAAVLVGVGGIGIWVALPQMAANLAAMGVEGINLIWGITILVGPTLLFPVWGLALVAATLGYYFRRRGPCSMCGRGAPA